MKDYLTTHYDHRAIYEEQLKPMIERIHAICVENNIPSVMMVSIFNDDERVELSSTCHLAGPDTVPAEMAAGFHVMNAKGPTEAMRACITGMRLIADVIRERVGAEEVKADEPVTVAM